MVAVFVYNRITIVLADFRWKYKILESGMNIIKLLSLGCIYP